MGATIPGFTVYDTNAMFDPVLGFNFASHFRRHAFRQVQHHLLHKWGTAAETVAHRFPHLRAATSGRVVTAQTCPPKWGNSRRGYSCPNYCLY